MIPQNDSNENNQSDDDVGRITKLVQILATDPGVIVRRGPLGTQGRITFGRQNEDADGVGLFIFTEDEGDDARE